MSDHIYNKARVREAIVGGACNKPDYDYGSACSTAASEGNPCSTGYDSPKRCEPQTVSDLKRRQSTLRALRDRVQSKLNSIDELLHIFED